MREEFQKIKNSEKNDKHLKINPACSYVSAMNTTMS